MLFAEHWSYSTRFIVTSGEAKHAAQKRAIFVYLAAAVPFYEGIRKVMDAMRMVVLILMLNLIVDVFGLIGFVEEPGQG